MKLGAWSLGQGSGMNGRTTGGSEKEGGEKLEAVIDSSPCGLWDRQGRREVV